MKTHIAATALLLIATGLLPAHAQGRTAAPPAHPVFHMPISGRNMRPPVLHIPPPLHLQPVRAAGAAPTPPGAFTRFSLSTEGHVYHYGMNPAPNNGGLGYISPYLPYYYTPGPGFGYAPGLFYGFTYPSYPYYYPYSGYGISSPSPYQYYGTVPPYISNENIYLSQPQGNYLYRVGTGKNAENYYLGRGASRILKPGPNLQKAVTDLQNAWLHNNISLIAAHMQRNVRIGIYINGGYRYSLSSASYLALTRDALKKTHTRSISLQLAGRPAHNIAVLMGTHTYLDGKTNKTATVVVCFAMQKINGTYSILEAGVDSQHR